MINTTYPFNDSSLLLVFLFLIQHESIASWNGQLNQISDTIQLWKVYNYPSL